MIIMQNTSKILILVLKLSLHLTLHVFCKHVINRKPVRRSQKYLSVTFKFVQITSDFHVSAIWISWLKYM